MQWRVLQFPLPTNDFNTYSESIMKAKRLTYIFVVTIHLVLFVVAILFLAPDLFAQPPGFPTAPNQTPIDGGLGAVAIGLGGWALKKLRANKKR